MIPGRIAGETRNMVKPPDWDNEKQGHRSALAIRDVETESGNLMYSAWYPTPAELERMQKGAPVYLGIHGTSHPVVMLGVAEVW